VTTVAGDYRYRVQDLQVVRPGDVAVLDAHPDPQHPGQVLPTLTLTTCNPKYSAAQRLVATAVLDAPKSPPPAAAPVVTKPVVHLDAPGPSWGTGHDRALLAGWGALLAVAGFAWWWLFHGTRAGARGPWGRSRSSWCCSSSTPTWSACCRQLLKARPAAPVGLAAAALGPRGAPERGRSEGGAG